MAIMSPWCSGGDAALRVRDAFSYTLFTSKLPQTLERIKLKVRVYFIYFPNPQIDCCKLLVIKHV